MEPNEEKQPIYITMLGKFEIAVGDTVITNSLTRTRQLWNLIEYLIAFRNKTISQDELIATLWPDDSSDNPASALKNLVYRARTAFSAQAVPFAKEMIVFSRGTYRWNNELDCVVDIEKFEQLYRCSTEMFISTNERIECCRSAIALYTGNFLPDSSGEEWVIPLVSYYRSIYFKCVKKIVELLAKENLYDEIYSICQKAITIDPYEELPHKYVILALAKQNNHAAALSHYQHVTEVFYRELGVKPSEDMRSLYREINKSINNVESDLEIIKDDLAERSLTNDAYYCDYEVFKNLYRVEARSAARSGQSVFIGLFTITDAKGQVPELQVISKTMDALLRCVKKSLRSGDIVSRFSATQFVLMFPSITAGTGQNILDRTVGIFERESGIKGIKIHTTVKAINPTIAKTT